MRLSPAVAVVFVLAMASPAPGIDLPSALTGYTVSSWADGDGRPLGPVYAIAQDHTGYLWIGTDAGLVRFDGSRFARWDAVGTTPLPNAAVSALFVSRDGTLWVGFRDDGIVRRIRAGAVQDDVVAAEQTGLVADFAEDGRGTMWAVIGGRLCRRQGNRWEHVALPTAGSGVVSVSVKRDGSIMVGTNRELFEASGDDNRFHLVRSGWSWDASESADGSLWVTDTSIGFTRVGGSRDRMPVFNGNGYRLLHDRRGNLWVATIGEGLWRTRAGSADSQPVLEKASLYSGLLSDSVQSVIEDREGSIWVGTTGGLHKLTERKVTPIVNIGLAIAVESTGQGGVWAGTGNGLVRLTPDPAESERERPMSAINPYVRVVHRNRDGVIWVGANQGLFRIIDGRPERIALPGLDFTGPTVIIASDTNGTVWLSDGLRVSCWRAGRLRSVPRSAAVPRDRISQIYGDSTGRLWIAFAGGLTGTIDSGGEELDFKEAAGLHAIHRQIYDIFEDVDGVIWVLGNGGLSRWSGDQFVTLTHAAGLPASRIGAMTDDRHGYLWLNLDAGLIRFTRQAFERAIADRTVRLQYDLYDASDGVAGAPILNVRAKRGGDGMLWFVRGGGLTSVNPDRLVPDVSTVGVPIRIEDAVVNDNKFAVLPGATLPSGTRRLQVNYTVLTFRSPSRIRFRYRLDGFDANWVDAGSRRQAFYTNLPPRRYIFYVEATADETAWNGAAAAWNFGIEPMFYQTGWFYFVGVVSIALAAGATWQFRVRLMRRQFSAVLAERARLAREIHDTLLQNMIGVALQFDALADSIGALSVDARHKLVRARKQAEGYIRDARQSIWDLRSPSLERRELATALREIGIRATQGTAVEFTATTIGDARQCSTKVENALLRIGQEAITNAIRHSRADRIDVELRFEPETLILRVRDNGCGFDAQQFAADSNGHYGLISMRERAEDIEAEFSISSAPARGTDVETVVTLETDR